jgi:hypothetical protein
MMRALLVFILISISMVLVHGAKTGAPSGTMDAIRSGKDHPSTDVKPAEATHPQKTVADAETQEALKQIHSEQKILMNPMLKRTLETDEGDLRRMGSDLKAQTLRTLIRVKALSMMLTGWCVATGAVILFLMLAVRRTRFSGIGYILAHLAYNVSRLILFTASLASAIAWFGLRYNFLGEMGAGFLGALFVLLLLSSVSLKLYDFNMPVWNRMLSSLVWPIIPNMITVF